MLKRRLFHVFDRKKIGLDDRDRVGLLMLGLGEGVGRNNFFLGLHNRHVIGQRLLWADFALGIPREHNLDPERTHIKINTKYKIGRNNFVLIWRRNVGALAKFCVLGQKQNMNEEPLG